MTTFIILFIIFLIWIVKSEVEENKKVDVVDTHQRESAINRLRPVRFNFREKSKLENVIRVLNTFDNNPITVFSYSDRFVFIKYKDGKNFTANLDQLEVLFSFAPATNSRNAIITLGSNQYTITEDRDETMTEKEWDTIFDILQCAKITHKRGVLTKESREESIRSYRMSQNMRRMNRNIQRMNRF